MRIELTNIQEGAWIEVLDYVPWSVMSEAMYLWQKTDSETKEVHATKEEQTAVNDTIVKEMVVAWNFQRTDGTLYDRAPGRLSDDDFKRIDGRVGAMVYMHTMSLLNKKPQGAAADPN